MDEAQKGNTLFVQGQFNEAIKLYTKVLKENASAVLLCNRASAYMRMDLYKTAIKDCDAAIALDKSCQKAYLIKGKALFLLKKKSDALKVWKEGSEIHGDVELFEELYKYGNEILVPGGQQHAQTEAIQPSPQTNLPETQTKQISQPEHPQKIQEPPISKSKGQTYLRGEDGQWISVAGNGPPSITGNGIAKSGHDLTKNGNGIPASVLENSRAASALVAARGMVQHGVGKTEIDEKIALGYLQVNTGNYSTAIELFSELLKTNPKVVAAYLGRGTALALSGSVDKAIADFSLGIEVDKTCVDAWKRRGHARAARGFDNEALADLTQAIVLAKEPDSESYHQRGLVYYKLHNYRRALADFKQAATLDKQGKLSWNHMGLCLNALGMAHEAIEAHARAIGIDPQFKEAWANMAQASRDLGMHEKAAQLFDKSLEIDPRYTHSFHLRGLLRFGVGEHKRALDDLNIAVQLAPNNKDFRHMRAVAAQGLGLLTKAATDYSILFSGKPDHVAWYQYEVTLFVHHKLDKDLSSFNIDKEMDPYFKEGWCKRNHPATLSKYKSQPPLNPKIPDVSPVAPSPDEKILIQEAGILGALLQYHAEGYLPNKRQQRAAGLAIIEIAQRLRNGIWKKTKKNSDLAPGPPSSLSKSDHKFGWRDLYDIAVKWRQYSEPNDPVWWVDLLSPEQFAEGFGSHTPMITGQTHVIRYYPMFERSFAIMKRLIPDQCNISEDAKREVEEAKECKDLHDIIRKDFYVVTPCHSTARPGSIMEGTRLTIQLSNPEGYEYSIRTPGTPPRWAEYNQEMTYVWELLTAEATNPNPDMEKVVEQILTLTFYWYNFMPLSRGTAAVGYMTMVAMFLAMGYQITAPIPENLQPDWEAILRPTPADFIQVIKPWLWTDAPRLERDIDTLPSCSKSISSIRKLIQVLNVD
eukprot:Phypoly_transcript_02165.p1 GENE.Phypoly_transcript_02165~~Phypoly_transcript_02165.p1  ORF type:complete len:924 (+),score=154.83 Phypoly_transcript_02165:113-2884(+)